jgi:hypothetical protein
MTPRNARATRSVRGSGAGSRGPAARSVLMPHGVGEGPKVTGARHFSPAPDSVAMEWTRHERLRRANVPHDGGPVRRRGRPARPRRRGNPVRGVPGTPAPLPHRARSCATRPGRGRDATTYVNAYTHWASYGPRARPGSRIRCTGAGRIGGARASRSRAWRMQAMAACPGTADRTPSGRPSSAIATHAWKGASTATRPTIGVRAPRRGELTTAETAGAWGSARTW